MLDHSNLNTAVPWLIDNWRLDVKKYQAGRLRILMQLNQELTGWFPHASFPSCTL
jgi:hypothetical protein